jgi:CDP-diacylglycerol--serine O-phosphatidyltransferase
VLVFAAMLFDALDGYAARLSKTASDFGGQLDSLCDAISFGAAPAFLLLRLGHDWENVVVHHLLSVIAAVYVSCAVLRLARFNLENSPDASSHRRFKGLPSPAAAGCVASLAVLRSDALHSLITLEPWAVLGFVKVWAPVGTLMVALLMVSGFAYPHLSKQILRGRRHFSPLARILMAVCAYVVLRELALLLLFWGYALIFPLRATVRRSLRGHGLPKPAGLDELIRR